MRCLVSYVGHIFLATVTPDTFYRVPLRALFKASSQQLKGLRVYFKIFVMHTYITKLMISDQSKSHCGLVVNRIFILLRSHSGLNNHKQYFAESSKSHNRHASITQ